MRVILTVHQFFPEFTAGTEVLTFSVAKDLLRRGHEVCVYTGYPGDDCLKESERFDKYDLDGLQVYRFHHSYTPSAGQDSMVELSYDNHLAAHYFRGVLHSFKPDVVHFFHLNRLGTGLIDVTVEAGVPAFFTPTDFWAVCHTAQLSLSDGRPCKGPMPHGGNCVKHLAQHNPSGAVSTVADWLPSCLLDCVSVLTAKKLLPSYPFRKEVAALGRRLDVNISRINHLKGVLSPNSFMTGVLTRHGVAPELISQSSYGVDVVLDESGRSCRSMRRPFRIGFIGTLARHKGCHVLIEAFKIFPAGLAELRIYGRHADFPDYYEHLISLARGRGDIDFFGVFPNSEIGRVLADIDILVVPSLWFENTPLVVYSAHAAKCLVVASDFPGLSDVVEHEKNGLLFEAGNAEALAQQLHRLFDHPDLWQRLVGNLRPPKSTMAYVDDLLALWSKEITVV